MFFFPNLMYSKEKEIIHIRQLSSYSVFGFVLVVLCQLSNWNLPLTLPCEKCLQKK